MASTTGSTSRPGYVARSREGSVKWKRQVAAPATSPPRVRFSTPARLRMASAWWGSQRNAPSRCHRSPRRAAKAAQGGAGVGVPVAVTLGDVGEQEGGVHVVVAEGVVIGEGAVRALQGE